MSEERVKKEREHMIKCLLEGLAKPWHQFPARPKPQHIAVRTIIKENSLKQYPDSNRLTLDRTDFPQILILIPAYPLLTFHFFLVTFPASLGLSTLGDSVG
jgi:hypothetical protein